MVGVNKQQLLSERGIYIYIYIYIYRERERERERAIDRVTVASNQSYSYFFESNGNELECDLNRYLAHRSCTHLKGEESNTVHQQNENKNKNKNKKRLIWQERNGNGQLVIGKRT